VKGLGLSEEQQKKLDPILADSRQQMMALQGLPDQERQAQARKIREASRVRIREILTPEQRSKYDESTGGGEARGGGDPRSGAPGRVWVLDGDKVKPIALTLGISDGAATEVLRGELKEGQEIIVGAVGSGKPASGSSTAPRLRL
jgi:HlyD family secretion protein